MNRASRTQLFPEGFPSELTVAAFTSGDEAAWLPELALAAVEWLGAHGYAVLGTELWLTKGEAIQSLPIASNGAREVHGNTVDRQEKEPWGSFVARAAAETIAYLRLFDKTDIVEPGEVHFNVVWVSESEFDKIAPV